MDARLTLKLNQEMIEKAKEYAHNKKMSLSGIVESYLLSLVTDKDSDGYEISPLVKSIATGNKFLLIWIIKMNILNTYRKDINDL